MKSIICDRCQKERPVGYFRKYSISRKISNNNFDLICDYCSSSKYQRLPDATVETKHCLKCDKPFRSVNGNRLCSPCKYDNNEMFTDYSLIF